MALITKYGSIWGAIPNTAGRVFWVAPTSPYLVEGRAYDASDGNDGLSPERALSTINRATVLATANAGDVIVMLPGTHSLTVAVTASVAGITYMGLPSGAGNKIFQRTVIAGTTAANVINLTATDCEFAYLHVRPSVGQIALDVSAGGERANIHHVSFDMFTAAASISTRGVNFSGAAAHAIISDCTFLVAGAQGGAVTIGAGTDTIVQDCDFILRSGTWAAAARAGAAGGARNVIRRCNFMVPGATATLTAGIDGSAADIAMGYYLNHCTFGATSVSPGGVIVRAVDNFGATTVTAIECYASAVDITSSFIQTLVLYNT